jgi:Ankyrin repeat
MSLFNFFRNEKPDTENPEKPASGNTTAALSREELHDKLTVAIGNRDHSEIRELMESVTAGNAPSIHVALNFDDAWFPAKGYDRVVDIMANNRFMDLNEPKDGKTPLILIAEACHNSTGTYALMVDSLLSGGADPNRTDEQGWSALAYVINKGNVSPDIIQGLIDAGADLNLVVESDDFMGINRRSILGMAYYNGKEFFGKLKEKGAKMTDDEIDELKDRGYPLEP